MKICYLCNAVSLKKFKVYIKKYNYNVNQTPQKYNRLLMLGLAENGADVTCISSRPIRHEYEKNLFFKKEKEREKGINFLYLPFLNFGILRNISVFLTTLFCLLKQRKGTVVFCDVLNFSMSAACLIAAKLKKLKTVAVVTDVPCYRPGSVKPTKTEVNSLKIIKQFEFYLLLTEAMNDIVNPRKKPYIVLEGHCDFAMKDIKNDFADKSNPRICLYAGSLKKVYGIKNLIDGFVGANLDNTELHIYGTGDFVDELIEICKQYPNVKYFGVAANEKIIQQELKATLLVNPRPTNQEYTKYSFPSKNMEYMASGTPLLTTKLPGMPKEYYDYVYLIDREDANGIQEKLREIFALNPKELHNFGLSAKDFILNNKNNIIQARKVMEKLIENSEF